MLQQFQADQVTANNYNKSCLLQYILDEIEVETEPQVSSRLETLLKFQTSGLFPRFIDYFVRAQHYTLIQFIELWAILCLLTLAAFQPFGQTAIAMGHQLASTGQCSLYLFDARTIWQCVSPVRIAWVIAGTIPWLLLFLTSI